MLFYIYVYGCRVAQNMTDAKPKCILILSLFNRIFFLHVISNNTIKR